MSGSLWHTGRCTACGGGDLYDFLDLRQVPTQDGVLWKSRAEATAAPKGDFILSVCRGCGYIGNRAYDASLVTFEGYDVSLEHSPSFRAYLEKLAERLVSSYGLRNKQLLEIGVGKGLFLRTLCKLGGNHGIGYDPSVSPELRDQWRAEGVTIVPDFFSEKYATDRADLVSCRHVLDILDRPREFLEMLSRSVGPDTVLYFESPNGDTALEDCALWTMVYEHCSWFTAAGARALFNACGFDILRQDATFGRDYVGIEARRSPKGPHLEVDRAAVESVLAAVSAFEVKQRALRERWRERLAHYRAENKRVIGWGAGARAISFLSAFGVTDQIPYVVDINTNRQGKYLPLTAQEVVAPEFAVGYRPDVILVTNGSFTEEIQAQARALGINPQFEAL